MEELTWQRTEGRLMARYSGEITMEVTQAFKREVEKALGEGPATLVLDLSEVNFIDSSGIGFLVACNTRLKSMGTQLVLLKPSAQVKKTLGLVQLMPFFAVAESEGEIQNLENPS